MIKYEEFCNGDEKLLDNVDFRMLFNFLSYPKVVISMLVMTNKGFPAISCIVESLETNYSDKHEKLPLSIASNRQLVERMIKYILDKFGYVPVEKCQLRSFTKAKYFKTSMLYEQLKTAVNHINVEIV